MGWLPAGMAAACGARERGMGGVGVGGPQNSFGHARVIGREKFSQIFKPGLKIYAD